MLCRYNSFLFYFFDVKSSCIFIRWCQKIERANLDLAFTYSPLLRTSFSAALFIPVVLHMNWVCVRREVVAGLDLVMGQPAASQPACFPLQRGLNLSFIQPTQMEDRNTLCPPETQQFICLLSNGDVFSVRISEVVHATVLGPVVHLRGHSGLFNDDTFNDEPFGNTWISASIGHSFWSDLHLVHNNRQTQSA